jgi:RNA methyltransferase, TrmH family
MPTGPGRPRPAHAPPSEEQTVYGVKAGLALLRQRPQDVRRIYHAAALRGALGPHLSAAAARRLPYRELDAPALAKLADSPHHEGLVVVAAPLRYRPLAPAVPAAGPGALWVALDGVENPHNLGALVRTAAFFGLAGVLAGGVAPQDKVNAAVLRVSEGGAEHVALFAAPRLPEALGALRQAGCRILGLETDAAQPLADAVAGGLTAGPLVLVLGGERAGLSPPVRRACDALCVLVGGGALDSLNVSVAAGVALAQVLAGRTRLAPAAPTPARPAPALPMQPASPPPRESTRPRPSRPRGHGPPRRRR